MPPQKTPKKATSLSKNSHPKKRQFLDGKGVLLLPCYPFIHPTIGPYIIRSIHPSNHRSIRCKKSIHHASMQSLIHPTFLPRNRLTTVMAIRLLMFCFPAQSRRLSLRRQRSLKRHRGQYLGRKPQCESYFRIDTTYEGVSSFHSTVCPAGVLALCPLLSLSTVVY